VPGSASSDVLLCFSHLRWNFVLQRPQHLLTRAAKDYRVFFFEEPRYGWWIASTNVARHTATLVDAWKPTRYFTFTPGINNIFATASNGRGDDLGSLMTWAPTVSAAWDATHDGRTVIRGSFNMYADVDMVNIARHSLGSQAQRQCNMCFSSARVSQRQDVLLALDELAAGQIQHQRLI
jgi:hypothetical protein